MTTPPTKKLTDEEIKARIKVVCICKGIKQARICDAVISGSDTVEKVNKKTGSGSGGCKGVRCRPVIETILDQKGALVLNPHKSFTPHDEEF
jgi:bacterioferritin-associated ferredoxin